MKKDRTSNKLLGSCLNHLPVHSMPIPTNSDTVNVQTTTVEINVLSLFVKTEELLILLFVNVLLDTTAISVNNTFKPETQRVGDLFETTPALSPL